VIVAVVVTHNSEQWIEQVLRSITSQTQPVDRIIIIDDGSTDDTERIAVRIAEPELTWSRALSTATDINSRIANNFLQGVQMCAPDDIVVLGDHDDTWLPNRVARQVRIIEEHPSCIMLAGDGNLVDVRGANMARRLHDVFPVTSEFNNLSLADQVRFTLHSSIATGSASALRPGGFGDALMPPPGWLHDRWWSIVAVVQSGMLIDDEAVIEYRVQSGQVIGLNRGSQEGSLMKRVGFKVRDGSVTLRKARDVTRLRSRTGNPQAHKLLTLPKLISLGLRPAPTIK
jgi:glycosyltransferase involved in cell wall biosynthesis